MWDIFVRVCPGVRRKGPNEGGGKLINLLRPDRPHSLCRICFGSFTKFRRCNSSKNACRVCWETINGWHKLSLATLTAVDSALRRQHPWK